MAPTASALRAAAEGLRTTARRLDLDVEPLADHGNEQTWMGPAARSYRRSAVEAQRRMARVTADLRRLADRLDRRAEAIEEALAAEAERRAAAEAQQREELMRRQWAALLASPGPLHDPGARPPQPGPWVPPGGGGHGPPAFAAPAGGRGRG